MTETSTQSFVARVQAPAGDERGGVRSCSFAPVESRIVNPLDGAQWDHEAISSPDFRFFHSSAWARALHSTYGHKPLYMRFERSGELAALVPLMEVRSPLTGCRGVCLPFTDFCGPLLFQEGLSELLVRELMKLGHERRWKHFELRGTNRLKLEAQPSTTFHGHSLDLRDGEEELFARLGSPVRRAIRKAERSGVRVEVARSKEAMLAFYRLHAQTRKRHGLPPQPFSFFRNIHEHVVKPGLGFVALASLAARPAAAAVFLHMGTKAVYKFGASDHALQEFRGNNLAMWEGIRFLAQSGCEELHLGRTSLGNEGLRRFKLALGAAEERINYHRFEPESGKCLNVRDKVSGFHNAIFRRMPVSLNRLAGAMIYPHID